MRFGVDRQGDVTAALPLDAAWQAARFWHGRKAPAQNPCNPSPYEQTPSDEELVFRAIGIGKPTLAAARLQALRNRTTVESELLASGDLTPAIYYEALADLLGLPFGESIAPESVVASEHLDAVLRRPERLGIEIRGKLMHAIAPRAADIAELRQRLQAKPDLHSRLIVTMPGAIREAVWKRRAAARAAEVSRDLFEDSAADSARLVLTGRQGVVAGIGLSAVLAAAIVASTMTLLSAHAVSSVIFLSCVLLRIAAAAAFRKPRRPDLSRALALPLPRYCVLVALYREERMIEQLLDSLSRLKWPRSLLDIKLVCEADDHATLAAIDRLSLPPEYEVVRVPAIGPRTKPKALKYALAGVRSDFLVVYDAEDRPHPDQLLEAWSTFSGSSERLAVLQAPLVISNAGQSRWASIFALEYAGLFRGLLPLLARWKLPLPLGGTSNHFRVSALRACGAWDPHNVTEDADLGLRLHRRGHRAGILVLPTQEPAPTEWAVWLRQRTRWFKGWAQTWLVMMRTPLRTWRETGMLAFLVFQIMIGGMLVSALVHPLLYAFAIHTIVKLATGSLLPRTLANRTLFYIDMFDIVGGYLFFALLAWRPMVALERSRSGKHWYWLPIYWLGMSAAAWKALAELAQKPFYWAKTPHAPVTGRSSVAQGAPARRLMTREEHLVGKSSSLADAMAATAE